MPELIHNFTSGRMNKDIDERMVPNGEYRDALNVTVATSEDSHVGALQNIKGNTQKKGLGSGISNIVSTSDWADSDYISSLSNPVCIGSIRHEPTECIYWFIASDNVSAIAEYNTKTKVVVPILVDTKGILSFKSKNHITGINIVDDLLFWTDNQTEPKKINIKKFKKGSSTFHIHSKIPTYNTSNGEYETPLGADFVEADITVIKKSPLTAPAIDVATSTRSSEGVEVPGTGVTPISTIYNFTSNYPETGDTYENFTYITYPATEYLAVRYRPLPTYGEWYEDSLLDEENRKYQDNMETVTIGPFNQAPTGWLEGDIIVLSGSIVGDNNNEDEYQIRIVLTQNPNGQYITGRILSIPSNILRQVDINNESILITWEALLEEKDPMFEFEFPRFAYRWKYENGEYSCFSPFTQVVFEGDDFEYLSSDGYNLGMQNHIRSLIIKDWEWGSAEVVEVDILFKKSRSNNIYVVDTIKDKSITSFQLKTELIGKTVEANQLLRPWDNVPRKALAQEISANRLIYANYTQNFDVPKSKLILNTSNNTHPGNDPEIDAAENNNSLRPFSSIKTIRKYQLGIVFQDTYGRQTPVFTNSDATIQIDKQNADKVNKLTAKLETIPNMPSWITHAKYFIKDTSNEYYNLALDRYYPAEDGNVWLSFPSSERNKVDMETYLILKKQHDNNNPSIGPCRYKILDIENSAPDFIANTKKCIAVDYEIEVVSGFDSDFSELNFKGPKVDENPQFRQGFNGDVEIQILYTSNKTDLLGVLSGGPVTGDADSRDYKVTLDKKMGSSAAFMGLNGLPNGTLVTMRLFKRMPNNLPEFEGRFFVKINKDTDFETNIVKPFTTLNKNYSTSASIYVSQRDGGTRTFVNEDLYCDEESDGFGFYWGDRGSDTRVAVYPGDACGWSPCNGKYKLMGDLVGGGNGSKNTTSNHGGPPNSDPETKMHEVYNRPYVGGKYISMVYVGRRTVDEEEFSTHGLQYTGKPMTDLAEGAKIRLVGKAGTDNADFVSGEYTVKRHYRCGQWRGRKKFVCSDCDSNCMVDSSKNKHIAIALELEEPLGSFGDEWIGDGSATALGKLAGIEVRTEDSSSSDNNSILSSTNPAIFETEPKEAVDIDIYYEASKAFPISEINGASPKVLDYSNVYSFGNAVESDRIRDDFNAPIVGKGVKVSSIFEGPYAEERRGSGLIFSGIYNSMSGINRTNQFIQGEPITKDLNPEYGSIQKLHSRNTNLITLCEDKCLQILANKDALFEASGNPQLISNNKVLGQAMPYAGEFGISKNPESFSAYGFRSYFADKNRGAIIRLSQDGITNIALKGMADFFSDNLPVCTKIIGSYDDDKENYNLTLDSLTAEWQDKLSSTPKDRTHCEVADDTTDNIYTTTLSFKETVGGWTSRKSYYSKSGSSVYPLESGVSINDRYYTFNKGLIWEEYSNDTYNNIYDTQYDSSVNVVLNDATETVKGFKTLNFSGSSSRRYTYGTSSGLSGLTMDQVIHQQITPSLINSETLSKTGWYTNYINTDIEEGSIKEFKKKENKWFQKIKGLTNRYVDNCDNNIDSSAFPVQGIGNATVTSSNPTTYNITVSVDTSCSTESTETPNYKSYFWYLWGGSNGTTDIRPETSDQNVKCAIETFYNEYPVGATNITKESKKFNHLASAGIEVGTYLHEEFAPFNLIGSAWDGKYLYIGQGDPSDSALNANDNSATVPDTYYIITVENSKITAKTQYNTLAACTQPASYITFTATTGIACKNNGPVLNLLTAYSSTAPADRAQTAKCGILEFLASIGGYTNTDRIGTSFKYAPGDGIQVGTQLYNMDDTPMGNSDDGIFAWNSNHIDSNDCIQSSGQNPSTTTYNTCSWTFNIQNWNTNANWPNMNGVFKFVVYENGIITQIKTMNQLNNC